MHIHAHKKEKNQRNINKKCINSFFNKKPNIGITKKRKNGRQLLIPSDEWTERLHNGFSTKLWSQGAEYDLNQLSNKFKGLSSNYIYRTADSRHLNKENMLLRHCLNLPPRFVGETTI